ncbi:uncharacterized protein TRUGW13939_10230 [Talaromyces rugulosus]|uniref:Uncharacterized protein n=1 Tax=Talaromyces rugulosus TaxID=121627 RepID=A0A7H8R9M2_TALRU|nr:uncharacterized protein TRUGW13939_10230 [Talaromyces rugulosus]QKX63062.1 hypothetical protein TRUGW13939_10230 [Talaromyces rugulosus]
MNPKTCKTIDGDIQTRTHQCIKNISAILDVAGSSIKNAVKVNIFLADMVDFDKMNEIYMMYCGVSNRVRREAP